MNVVFARSAPLPPSNNRLQKMQVLDLNEALEPRRGKGFDRGLIPTLQ